MKATHFLKRALAAWMAACLGCSPLFAAANSVSYRGGGSPMPPAVLAAWSGAIGSFLRLPGDVASFQFHPTLVQSIAVGMIEQGYAQPESFAAVAAQEAKSYAFQTAVQAALADLVGKAKDPETDPAELPGVAAALEQMPQILPAFLSQEETREAGRALSTAQGRISAGTQAEGTHIETGIQRTVADWSRPPDLGADGRDAVSSRYAPGVSRSGLLPAENGAGHEKKVDVASADAVYVRGLDSRLLPVVQEFKAGIESNPDLGHLGWALVEFLKQNGTIRYAVQRVRDASGQEQELNFNYMPSAMVLHYNPNLERVNPKLQAALFAAHMQEVYDNLIGRSSMSQEAAARRARVAEAFLKDTDMEQLAQSLDLNNDTERWLFRTLIELRVSATLGFERMAEDFSKIARAEDLRRPEERDSESIQNRLRQLEDDLGLINASIQRAGAAADPRLEQYKRRVLLEMGNLKAELTLNAAAQSTLASDARAGARHYLDTPLGDRAHRASLEPGELRAYVIVGHRDAPEGLGLIEEAMRKLEQAILGSEPLHKYEYLLRARDMFVQRGGRFSFGQMQGAFAFVAPLTLDLVTNLELATLHPVYLASIFAQELSHVADLFGVPRFEGDPAQPRALTRETEEHGWRVQAEISMHMIFAPAPQPGEATLQEKIAQEVVAGHPDKYHIHLNRNVFSMLRRIAESYRPEASVQVKLVQLVADLYRSLFGTFFVGLPTAGTLRQELVKSELAPAQEKIEDLKLKETLVAAEQDANPSSGRAAQLERIRRAIALWQAVVTLSQLRLAQLDRAIAEDGGVLPSAPQPVVAVAPQEELPPLVAPPALLPEGATEPQDAPAPPPARKKGGVVGSILRWFNE